MIKSTPIARALAAKLGIDIELVKGSGIDGRILVEDVKNYKPTVAAVQAAPVAAPTAAQDVAVAPTKTFKQTLEAHSEPVTSIRKAIAKAMTNS